MKYIPRRIRDSQEGQAERNQALSSSGDAAGWKPDAGVVDGQVAELKIGSTVPDFILSDKNGRPHKLSSFRGMKVMLCFYRYSYCPACAYTISKLIGEYKKLAWASKLKVIMVFRTDVAYLKKGLEGSDAPIRRLSGTDNSYGYPFLALADPDGKAAATFQVVQKPSLKYRSFFKAIVTPSIFREIYLNGVNGGDTLLPSELLIDENGVLVDVLRAKKKTESMAMGRVNNFLLQDYVGQPCNNGQCERWTA